MTDPMTEAAGGQVAVTQEETEAIAWVHQRIEFQTSWLLECQKQVAAFEAMPSELSTFADSWRLTRDAAETRLVRAKALAAIIEDRDEWRAQHENLLAIRQQELATLPALGRDAPVEAAEVVASLIEEFGYDPVWAERLRGHHPKEASDLFAKELRIAQVALATRPTPSRDALVEALRGAVLRAVPDADQLIAEWNRLELPYYKDCARPTEDFVRQRINQALSSLPSSERAGEVAIKPLRWQEPHPSHSYPNWHAYEPDIGFEARIDTGKAARYGKFPLSINRHMVDEKFNTVAAAKAYAQEDYADRILAALNPTEGEKL